LKLALLLVGLAALSGCDDAKQGAKTPARDAHADTTLPAAGDGDQSANTAPASAATAASGALLAKVKKRITFAGSRGDSVPGYLWLPARRSGQKLPAILAMYGIDGSKDDSEIAHAADLLTGDGYAVMTIDWPGTGDRGSISKTDRVIKKDVLTWTVGDYKVAVDFLQAQPEVDPSRLGYVGASMGAMTGIAFASREPRIKTLVAVVPIPNPLWGGDDPEVLISRLGRPVLCINTDDNSDFSALVCNNNVGAGSERQALPGGHELEGFRDQVVQAAKTFLDKNLKP